MVIIDCPHCKASQLVGLSCEEKELFESRSCAGCGKTMVIEQTLLGGKIFTEDEADKLEIKVVNPVS